MHRCWRRSGWRRRRHRCWRKRSCRRRSGAGKRSGGRTGGGGRRRPRRGDGCLCHRDGARHCCRRRPPCMVSLVTHRRPASPASRDARRLPAHHVASRDPRRPSQRPGRRPDLRLGRRASPGSPCAAGDVRTLAPSRPALQAHCVWFYPDARGAPTSPHYVGHRRHTLLHLCSPRSPSQPSSFVRTRSFGG